MHIRRSSRCSNRHATASAIGPPSPTWARTLSYDDIDRLSKQFASYLLNELKLKKGDRVAIMLPNVLQYPVALFGVLRAGLTVVNTNPLYTARELRHQLHDSGASAIIVLDNFAATLAEVLHDTPVKHVITTALGDLIGMPKGAIVNFVVRHVKKMVPPFSHSAGGALQAGARASARASAPPKVSVSATTTSPSCNTPAAPPAWRKARCSRIGTWSPTCCRRRRGSAPTLREGEEVIITAIPLYHIFALTANCLVFMKTGGLNYLITNPRDMKGFVKELGSVRFTAMTGVNTLFNGLLNTPGFDKLDFSTLQIHAWAAAWRCSARSPNAGRKSPACTLVEAYGLTETSPAACINPLDLPAYNGSIGLPIPSTDATHPGRRRQACSPVGEVGELCLRGPQVMKGYWQRPDETAKVITPDGWLHTGDIAKMDEKGYFYIVDRKKDMILVSGFNVYPNEIEDVVAQHSGRARSRRGRRAGREIRRSGESGRGEEGSRISPPKRSGSTARTT